MIDLLTAGQTKHNQGKNNSLPDAKLNYITFSLSQAGIKDEQLLLALEPECAALLCKHLALTKKADECNVRTFDPDSKFMVVDCGGMLFFLLKYRFYF